MANQGRTTGQLAAETPDARADAAAEAAAAANPEAASLAKANAETGGRRFRAIPTHGGSTVRVSSADFEALGVKDHPTVVWDFRKNETTVEIGNEDGKITEEAAKALNKHEPTRFEFING